MTAKCRSKAPKLAGMTDHIVLAASHTFIMSNPVVMAEVLEFLRYGQFDHGITFVGAMRKLASP